MFSLGKLANNVHSEKSSSAMLQECTTGREQLTFSLGNLKCAARASCGAKILYTILKKTCFQHHGNTFRSTVSEAQGFL